MKLADGWFTVARNDGIAQIGMDPEYRLVWDDPHGKINKIIIALELGCSKEAYFELANKQNIGLDFASAVIKKVTEQGAISGAKVYKPDSLCVVKQYYSQIRKRRVNSTNSLPTKISDTARKDYVKDLVVWISSSDEQLFLQLVEFCRQFGIAECKKWNPGKGVSTSSVNSLVVDIDGPIVNPDRYNQILEQDIPYLSVTVSLPWKAEVGPFVVPGKGACKRCDTMQRMRQDPAWIACLLEGEKRPCPEIIYEIKPILAACIWEVVRCWRFGIGNPGEIVTIDLLGNRKFTVLPDNQCGCVSVSKE